MVFSEVGGGLGGEGSRSREGFERTTGSGSPFEGVNGALSRSWFWFWWMLLLVVWGGLLFLLLLLLLLFLLLEGEGSGVGGVGEVKDIGDINHN